MFEAPSAACGGSCGDPRKQNPAAWAETPTPDYLEDKKRILGDLIQSFPFPFPGRGLGVGGGT